MIGYGKYDEAPHTCLHSQEKYGAASARPYLNHNRRSFSELQTDYSIRAILQESGSHK